MGQRTANGVMVEYTSSDSNTARTVLVTGVTHVTGGSSYKGSSEISFRIGGTTIASATASGTTSTALEAAVSQFTSGVGGVSYDISKTHNSRTVPIVLSVFGSASQTTTTVPAKPSYTVTYNANGGSGAPAASTKWYGETLTLSSSKPTRTGYTFKGWGTSNSATSASYQPGGSYTANSGTTLYAVWQINTHTVSYANGGRGTAPSSQTKTYGTNLTLRAGLGVVSNYRFSKWKATDGTLYDGGGTYSKNAATTMTAQWIAPYTISYNGNGSTGGSTSAQTKVHDTAINLQSNGFTRTNYAFAGWNTKANGSGTAYSAGQSYTANAALTLYAQWTQVYASPTLTVSKAYRADSSGTASDEGTYLALEASYSVYSGGGNAIDSWLAECNGQTESTPTSGGADLSGTVKFVIAANLLAESSYPVTLTLTDTNGGASGLSSGTVTKTFKLGVAAYPLDVWRYEDDGSYGVAIGGLVTRRGLDVYPDAYFRGNVTLTNALPIASGGTGMTSASEAWTALGGGSIGKKDSLAASDIPNLAASKITSGTLPIERGGTGKTTAEDAWDALGGGSIGKKDSLAAGDIPALAASKITSGTFDVDRIPSLAASKINSGTFSADRIPSLSISKITGDVPTAQLTLAGKYVTGTGTYTVGASTAKSDCTATISIPSGYTIKGIVRISTGANWVVPYAWSWSGSTVTVSVRNFTSSAQSNKTLTVGVICMPS